MSGLLGDPMKRWQALMFGLLLLQGTALTGEDLQTVSPERIGLSAERLDRIDRVMEEYVAAGRMSGAIGLIARQGQIGYFQTWGYMDKEAGTKMSKDAIFQMYSMTKAVTGVATMILFEEGHYFLNDPVSKYLPELGGLDVAIEETDPSTGKRVVYTVPSKQDMTIRDLLRHTSGLSYRGARAADGKHFYDQVGVEKAKTLKDMIKRIAKVPLEHQPGTTWHYGYSNDVLARLVEVVSGMPVDRFFQERIFGPLKMVDTGFHVPKEKWDRLAVLYTPNDDGTVRRSTEPPQERYKYPPTKLQGGTGLVSTTTDYFRFCAMLANGGEFDGVRILSRKSVELMRADHLGDIPSVGGTLAPGYGFGLTFAVNRGPGETGVIGSKGTYRWGGAAGTRFWIDPKEAMIGVYMVQILPHTGLTYGHEFKRLAYQAIVD